MTRIHWFLITLVLQFEVNTEGTSTGTVACNNDHTVTITITNVVDIAEFNTSDWRINDKAECEPVFNVSGKTVIYTNLPVGSCSSTSKERDNDILYVFKIRALPTGNGPTQAFDHMYDISCAYVNNDTVTASFIPLTKRGNNASDTAFFTFTLGVFHDANFSTSLLNPVALNQPLYFKALVVTSSSPNLDLFILSCHSSKQNDPNSDNGKVVLIQNGCGNDTVSQDKNDTLSYTCANDSKQESFKIRSFRYFGVDENESVYVHCEFKVCLADSLNSECECPTECDPDTRKRRSLSESVVYRVTTGPYYSVKEKKKIDDDDDHLDETRSEDKGPFYLNLAIILAVSGVVIAAIACLTVFLILRKRQQHFPISEKNKSVDLSVKT